MTDRQPFLSRGVVVAVMAGLVALLAGGGWWTYKNLFFQYTPAYRASERLFQAARQNKALTPAEFARALELAEREDGIVALRMFAALDLAVDANPDYKPAAMAMYTRRAADPSDPRMQGLAARKVAELTAPPP